MYAVADRVYPQDVSTCKPQKSIKTLCMDEFLPTPAVQEAFVEDLTCYSSHIGHLSQSIHANVQGSKISHNPPT